MALDIDRYRQNKSTSYSIGKCGEDVVSSRLKELGWSVKQLDDPNNHVQSGIVDFEIWAKNSDGAITQRRLVEVKSRKTFGYKHNTVPCLALPCSQCDKYDDYYKKRNLPLYIFWADFYNKEILQAEFRTLFEVRTKIDGELFPLVLEISGVENYLLPKETFTFFGKILDEEYKKWRQALEKNLRTGSYALSS